MRASLVLGSGACALCALVVALPGQAQSTPEKPAVLWYRSSEGCPDGAGFLERVGDRASLVRLAGAGDRVDFVVNIALTEEGARGRLERETERGTVAIREVEDRSCDRVADVVALNLALALDPDRTAAEAEAPSPPEPGAESSTPAPAGSSAAPDHAPLPTPTAPPPAAAAPVPPPDTAPATSGADPSGPGSPGRWRVGVQGGVLGRVSKNPMAKGAAFVQVAGVVAPLPDSALRLTALGALGSSNTGSGVVDESLWSARLDVCPLGIGARTLSLAPCGTGEIGQLGVSRQYRDTARWAALGALVRGEWIPGAGVALEAELGVVFPLSRYEVTAGSTVLYRSEPVGISGVVGASIAF